LRQTSSTFLHWHAEVLSADNQKTIVIPEGFAHGFQVLSEDCEMLYFHTAYYQAGAEDGLSALDPKLAIVWPLPVVGLSPRDAAHPLLDDAFTGIAP
jgi:dTDP-4-dehydrorhamnose 3,5-epimerase